MANAAYTAERAAWADVILKKFYEPRMVDAILNHTFLIQRWGGKAKRMALGGEAVHIPIHTALTEGHSYTDGSRFPLAQEDTAKKLNYMRRRLYGKIEYDGLMEAETNAQKFSYWRQVESKVQSLQRSLRIGQNEDMILPASGVRAKVTSDSYSNGTTTVTAAAPYGVKFLRPGMKLGCFDNSSGTYTLKTTGTAGGTGVYTVGTVTRPTTPGTYGTFTLTGLTADPGLDAGDVFFRCSGQDQSVNNDAYLSPWGIMDAVDTIDPSIDPTYTTPTALPAALDNVFQYLGELAVADGGAIWQSQVYDASSTAFDPIQLQRLVDNIREFGAGADQGNVSLLWTTYAIIRDIKANALVDRRFMVKDALDVWAGAVKFDGMDLVPDPKCPWGSLYGFDESFVAIGEDNGGEWRTGTGGGIWFHMPDADFAQATWKHYWNMVYTLRSGFLHYKNISTQT